MNPPAAAVLARDLGPRGSRSAISDSDPTTSPTHGVHSVLAQVPAWWAVRARAAGLSGRWLDVRQAIDTPTPAPTDVAADAAHGAAWTSFELGAAYAAALTPDVRARHGRHYTPEVLAEHLWMMARKASGHERRARPLSGLVRDPACGAGALLLPVVREHLAALVRSDPRLVLSGLPNVVQGVDADPVAVWLANVVLGAEALPLLAAVPESHRRPLPALAVAGDGLAPPSERARLVLMNPPYGRVRLNPEDRQRFAPVLYGHANLYGLFVHAGLEALADDGVLAALVPTSFTAGLYFCRLRQQLSKIAPLRDATFVADRDGIFTGVLQETCLAVFSRRRSRRTTIASMNGTASEVARVASPRGSGPWLLPRRADDAHIAAAAAAMPLTLGQIGWKVSTGPLVWNRRRDDLHRRPAKARLPVLWAADLDGGRLHRDAGRDALRYLTIRDAADRRAMALAEPGVLVQRTTAPEQRRRIIALELTDELLQAWGGAVVVENHVNVLRPRDTTTPPALSQATIAAILDTRVVDQLARCLSGSVALSAYELESLPLPDLSVLAQWESLRGLELEHALAAAYHPSSS